MAAAPKSLMIRSYHVGFGDCFLLSFAYGPRSERHVLIDFGSTGLPEGTPRTRMMDIAKGISRNGPAAGWTLSSLLTGTKTTYRASRPKTARGQVMSYAP